MKYRSIPLGPLAHAGIEVAMSLLFEKYGIITGGCSLRNKLSYYLHDLGLRLCNVDPEIWCDT